MCNLKHILISFFLLLGCQDQPTEEVPLDASLNTHYSLIIAGNTGSARVRIRQYMDDRSASAQPLFLLGLSYHQEKKYTKAVEWFEKAATFDNLEDRYPPTWHFLGWSYYYLGEVEKSKNAFNTFLTMHPKEGDSLFGLGLLAMNAGNLNEAEVLYTKSIAAQEGNSKPQAKAMSRLGDVFVLQGNVNAAQSMYMHAVELDPDLYEAWYRLATTYDRSTHAARIEQLLKKSKEAKERFYIHDHVTRFPE
jgi:tetratricopeptide (TPR) repeat protein|tara:strand:+ start:4466 stop:5212 length:747 start_codon:yes stop_codon:yes gene_type:complete